MTKRLFTLAMMFICAFGAWADETSWTWNFTDNNTWTTAKIVTGSDVTLNTGATTPGTGEYGVTFNFVSDKASITSNGLGYLSDDLGNSTTVVESNYVSIEIPVGFQATFNFTSAASSGRAIYYTTDGSNTQTNNSSNIIVYRNEGENPVTLKVWAKNPVKSSASQNIISSIVLEYLSNITYHRWTVNAIIKNTDTQIDTWTKDEIAEGSEFTAYLKKVIKYNEQYYELADDTYTGLFIQDTMNEDKVYSVNYQLSDDIVFFKEGEDITQSTVSETASGGAFCGYIGRPIAASAITIPNAGYYKAEALVMETRKSPVLTFWTGTNNYSNNNSAVGITIGDGVAGLKYSDKFQVNSSTTYYLGGTAKEGENVGYNNSLAFDYIIIRKLPAPTIENLAAASLTYTGEAQNLITTPTVTGGTITYSTAETGEYSTTIPTGKNAGNYSVWYKVEGDETHNDIAATEVEGVKINKATNTLTGNLTIEGWTYGATANTPFGISATFGEVGYKYSNAENGEYGTYDAIVKNAVGTWWVKAYVEGTDNYTAAESSPVSFTISSVATTISVTAQDYSGTYDGAAHGISVTAEEGATITYRTTDSEEYNLTENPTYTNVGSYIVYYKVTKDNCEDVTGSKTVTINPAAGSINAFSPASGSVAMGTTGFVVTTTATGDGTITYSSSDESVATINTTTGAVTPVAAGTTTITATVADKDGGNYTYAAESNTATYELTVTTSEPVTYTVTKGSESHCKFTVEPVGDNVTEGATITVNVTSVDAGYYVNYIGYEYYDETQSRNRTVKEYTERTETITETFAMPALNITVKVGTAKHTHNFSYEIGTGDNSNVLTATCSANGCGLSGKSATLTLTANGGTYSGSAFAATTDLDAFNQATGLSATCSINYTGDSEYNSSDAPTNVGSYTATATVTIGETNYTLTKTFTISAASVTTYSITLPTTVNGNSVTANVDNLSSVVAGTEITLTITTTENYMLTSISATGVTLSGNSNIRTFTMPSSNVTITANWEAKTTESAKTEVTENVDVVDASNATVTSVEVGNETTTITISGTVSDGTNNVPVTTIAEGTFTADNTANVQSIDLSKTQVALSGERSTNSVLKDIPTNTLVYLPSTSNVSGDNVIIYDGEGTEASDYRCNNFVMTDTKSYSVPQPFTATNATLSRSFTSGVTCTVCLPYDVPAGNLDGNIYQFSEVNGTTVKMTQKEGGLVANTPYIFVPSGNVTQITATSVTINMSGTPNTSPDGQSFTFKGVFEHKDFTTDEISGGIYGFAADANHGALSVGQFVKASNGAWTEGMRAYLAYSGSLSETEVASTRGEGLPEVLNVVLIHANGSTTNIGSLELMTADDGSPVYNLNGQRVDNSYKGLVIKNGKKVVKK